MKLKGITKTLYRGSEEIGAFVVSFQELVLRALKKRGKLTEKQMEKGLQILKELGR